MNTLSQTIDYISINDIFWVHLKSHLISFGFEGLPINIHFTIGFDHRSSDVNLHITKNVSDASNKPKIKIVCIDKTLLGEIVPSLSIAMLNKVLIPIDFDKLKCKYDYCLGFLSFDSLENSETLSLTEKELINSFKIIAEIRRKTRLKIKGNLEKQLEILAISEDLQASMFKNIVELTNEFEKPVDGGIIISEDSLLHVIRINDKWFTIKQDLNLFDFITTFINAELATQLIWKTKRALVSIRDAKTYADTQQFDNPVRLIRTNTKE